MKLREGSRGRAVTIATHQSRPAYDPGVDITVAAQRLGYRLAYRLLALRWTALRTRPDGVKCLIADRGRLLLVRHSYGPRGWDLPGGAHRRGESPQATARREMTEELSLPAGDWNDLGALRGRHGDHTIHILATTAPTGFTPDPDPVELTAAAWFDPDRIPLWTAPLLPKVLDALAAHERRMGDDSPGTGIAADAPN